MIIVKSFMASGAWSNKLIALFYIYDSKVIVCFFVLFVILQIVKAFFMPLLFNIIS